MKPPSKPILIVGGIALAAGAIYYIKKQEKPQEEFIPVEGPKTYYGSQEAAGNFGNFGGGGGGGFITGGGVPSTSVEGVTTVVKPRTPREIGEPKPRTKQQQEELKKWETEQKEKLRA